MESTFYNASKRDIGEIAEEFDWTAGQYLTPWYTWVTSEMLKVHPGHTILAFNNFWKDNSNRLMFKGRVCLLLII